MSVFDAKVATMLKKALADLRNPVRLLVFTREHECQYCAPTRDLITELAEFSDLVTAEPHDFEADAELAATYGIERVPAIVIQGEEDVGLRYYGVPAQHEFATLIEAILDLGTGRPSPLEAETLAALQGIDQPVTIKVFVTPT